MISPTYSLTWAKGPRLLRYWPYITLTVCAVIGSVWYMLTSSVGMLAVTLLTVYLAIVSSGFGFASIRAHRRIAVLLNWTGSISGALAFVLLSPDYLPIALLCILEGALSILSLDGSSRRELRAFSIVTVCTVSALLVLIELQRTGLLPLPFHPTPIEMAVTFFGYMLGYGLSQLRHIHGFFEAIFSTVQNLQRTLEEKGATEHETSQRLRERARLLEISRLVSSTQNFASLLQNILMQLRTVVDFYRAAVLLDRDGVLQVISSYGDAPMTYGRLSEIVNSPTNLLMLRALKSPMRIDDLRTDYPDLAGAWMGVPLIVRGKFIGLLSVRSLQPGFYTQHAADLCMAFANQVAGLIDSAQLQEAATTARVVAERHRLARELHDSVSQSLFGIVLGTRTALEQIATAPDAARYAIRYSINLADSALAEMRALIFALRPETLERRGLIAALQAQIDLLQPHHGITIVLEAPQGEPNTSIHIKEALYRISTEAVQNAIRHSNCRTLTIRLTHDEHQVFVDVVDDGCGFDPYGNYVSHLGLKTMRERATALGGVLSIDSSLGTGTCVSTALPRS